MEKPETFILNNKTYVLEQLASSSPETEPDSLTAYETEVRRFCRQWLSGRDSFSVQTSGSTGKPKTVALTRAQMQHSARLTGQALGLQAGDYALACLPVRYIAGMMMLVRGFVLGLSLVVIEPGGNPVADFPPEARFDFTALTPLQLQQILADSPDKLPLLNGMKAILVGGAPVSGMLLNRLQPVTAPLYHTYGMTETVTHIALKRLNGPGRSDYFTPLPGVRLGLDERGCLTIQSDVTRGEKLYTNDLVELRADGSFKWLGRVDHTINSGGIKVQIEKVETALETVFHYYRNGSLAQRRFFVGPVDHDRLGQMVVAVLEGPAFPSIIEAEIQTELLKSLGKYELPRRFYFTDRLLETLTGKIDRPANLRRVVEENDDKNI